MSVNIIVCIFVVRVYQLNEVLDSLRCDPCAGGASKGATDVG